MIRNDAKHVQSDAGSRRRSGRIWSSAREDAEGARGWRSDDRRCRGWGSTRVRLRIPLKTCEADNSDLSESLARVAGSSCATSGDGRMSEVCYSTDHRRLLRRGHCGNCADAGRGAPADWRNCGNAERRDGVAKLRKRGAPAGWILHQCLRREDRGNMELFPRKNSFLKYVSMISQLISAKRWRISASSMDKARWPTLRACRRRIFFVAPLPTAVRPWKHMDSKGPRNRAFPLCVQSLQARNWRQ